jgi:DNA polymerase-1
MTDDKKNILVIDAMNTLIQLHHSGVAPQDVLWSVTNLLRTLCLELQVHRTILAVDGGDSRYRLGLLPSYKGERKRRRAEEKEKFPEKAAAFERYLKACYAYFKAAPLFGIEVVRYDGVEADDIIAYLSRHVDLSRFRLANLSSDTDLLQLLRPGVVQRSVGATMGLKPTDVKIPPKVWVNLKRFFDAYQITPAQYVWMKALAGDTGDSVPSPEWVGEGTALKLMQRYQSIDNVKASLHCLDIPRMPAKAKQSLADNWELVGKAHKLVNLLHSEEEERAIFAKEDLESLASLVADLDRPAAIAEEPLKEMLLQAGKVQACDNFTVWSLPFRSNYS